MIIASLPAAAWNLITSVMLNRDDSATTERQQRSSNAPLNPLIERQPSRPPRHYAKRHRRPRRVHRPAVRHGKLDYESHQQEPARSQSRRQPENEENGKENFGRADKIRHDPRSWKRVRATRQMQLELRAEEEDRDVVQLQETVPFVDPGSPEWSREPDAQDKLGKRRLGDQPNNCVNPLTNRLIACQPPWATCRSIVISFLHKALL